MKPGRISAVRAFNRFYTPLVGALGESSLYSPYSLTEARVLFELAQQDSTEVPDLRRAVSIDAGYLSRLLSRFEANGLITRERSSVDARRQVIELTEAGRAAFASVNARSVQDIETLLSRLPEPDQRRLTAAMDTIREVLDDAPAPRTVVLRPPRPGDLGWVVERNAALYAMEYGWDANYEALVARIIADYVDKRDPRTDAAWIAEVNGERVGSVFCVREDDRTARLRLLLVEPGVRGLGIGGRLVAECLAFARTAGYRDMVLWTNDVLTGARRIYERAGFTLVEQNRHHSFGHDLVGQTWSLRL